VIGRVLTLAGRELGAMFRLPVGWIVIAVFMMYTGALFARFVAIGGEPASLRLLFGFCLPLLIVLAPAISMRLISDERRTGSIESLLTGPASDAEIIAGKFLGALGFLLAMLAPTLAQVALLYILSDPAPDAGPIISGYLSLVLVGGLYLSIGLLASCLTASQTLAFLGAFLALLALLVGPALALGALGPTAPQWARTTLGAMILQTRVDAFAAGTIQTRHAAVFIIATLWFLIASWGALTFRRTR